MRPPSSTAWCPLLHRHRDAPAGPRPNIEVVHQAPRTRQTKPRAAAARVPVLHREIDVLDAGPLVARDHHDALATRLPHQLQLDVTALRVKADVAGHLG